MTGTIKNAVSHAELTQEVTALQTAIGNASENYYADISSDFTFNTSSISKFPSNAIHVYRYGRMVSISIAFGVTAAISANTRLFTFPEDLRPIGNVYGIFTSAAGNSVIIRKADGNNVYYVVNDNDMPESWVYRGVLTYCIADEE